ncbi:MULTISPECIES: CitMHS family transporter [Brevibacterium]|uniref:Citrate:proton symporter n=1 Tax=Brevibacterium salitolerans TaxID=1403566 RepID=A0ABN2WPF1_9MICO|nr:citrate:proton symporter [Brevibacterium sp.]
MLSLIGYATMLIILALLLTQRVSPVVALAGVPIVAALIAGNPPGEVSGFLSTGVAGVVDVVVMFVFAIVFFGILRNAGFFDPVIDALVRFGGGSPRTVTVATTALACVAHLDGAGATTFLVTIPAMLPLYQRLGMSRLTLTACVGLGAGVMNILPWGGPSARAAVTVGVDANELWVPLIPAQIVGIAAALAIAFLLGHREARRLARGGAADFTDGHGEGEPASTDAAHPTAPVPRSALRQWTNGLLLLAALGVLMSGIVSPAMVFMVATILALLLNHRGMKSQVAQFDHSAQSAMLMASTLLAAGVLLGVLEESGMIAAMAKSAAGVLPTGLMPVLPLLVGILGVPMSLLFGPDAYYFGVLPVLTAVGAEHGIDPVVLAQASIIGQETVGFPISPLTGAFYLLVGLGGVSIGRHILNLIGWAWIVSVVMLVVAVLMGVIPAWTA